MTASGCATCGVAERASAPQCAQDAQGVLKDRGVGGPVVQYLVLKLKVASSPACHQEPASSASSLQCQRLQRPPEESGTSQACAKGSWRCCIAHAAPLPGAKAPRPAMKGQAAEKGNWECHCTEARVHLSTCSATKSKHRTAATPHSTIPRWEVVLSTQQTCTADYYLWQWLQRKSPTSHLAARGPPACSPPSPLELDPTAAASAPSAVAAAGS